MYIDEINNIVYLSPEINSSEDAATIECADSTNIIFGESIGLNPNIVIKSSHQCTINSNAKIRINESDNIYIGDGCSDISLEKSHDIVVGDNCSDINVLSSSYSRIGDESVEIRLENSNTTELSGVRLTISGDYHNVVDSIDIQIDRNSMNHKVQNSSDVSISNSLSIECKSESATINDTSNSEILIPIQLSNGSPNRIYFKDENGQPSVKVDDEVFKVNELGFIEGQHGDNVLEAPQDGRPYVRMGGAWYAMVPDSSKTGGWDFVKSTEKA